MKGKNSLFNYSLSLDEFSMFVFVVDGGLHVISPFVQWREKTKFGLSPFVKFISVNFGSLFRETSREIDSEIMNDLSSKVKKSSFVVIENQ